LRSGAGCKGNLKSVAGAVQPIQLALPRFVNLSNWAVREFDVSLAPDGGRKIVSKVRRVDELRASRRADVKIGGVA
jgi:hypothetical protein